MDLSSIITSEKVLFFDMDGTLVNTDIANNLAYNKAILTVMGYNCNVTNIRITRQNLKNFFPNISGLDYNAIVEEKKRIYSTFLDKVKPNFHIVKLLKQYASSHDIYLITRSHKKRAIETLEYFGFLNDFKRIICSESDNKYQDAINQLSITPNNIVVFEDNYREIENCIKIGILCKNIITVNYESFSNYAERIPLYAY